MALGSAALALSCGRETIGLGRHAPDAAAPSLSGTSPSHPEPRPDASVATPSPSASGTHGATPLPWPPVKLPPHQNAHDAGEPHDPPTTGHPVSTPDSGSGCKTSADCDYNAPFCQVETGKCVKCLSDLTCAIGLHCVDNECICTTAADCRYSTGTCDPTTKQCLVGCNGGSECTQLFSTICEPSRGVCIQCREDTDCVGKTFAGVSVERCHNAVCVQCVDDSGCSDTKPHCQTREGVCVDCLKTAQCPDKATCFDGHCIASPPPPAQP